MVEKSLLLRWHEHKEGVMYVVYGCIFFISCWKVTMNQFPLTFRVDLDLELSHPTFRREGAFNDGHDRIEPKLVARFLPLNSRHLKTFNWHILCIPLAE